MKVMVIFDTRRGNVHHKLAEAVAQGAREVEGTEVSLRRVEITEPESVIQQNEAWRKANEKFKAVPQVTVDEMVEADALVFGSPTGFGNMTAPMKSLWAGQEGSGRKANFSARLVLSSPAPSRRMGQMK